MVMTKDNHSAAAKVTPNCADYVQRPQVFIAGSQVCAANAKIKEAEEL